MELLEKNLFFITPMPKYWDIRNEPGITLSSLWTIFPSKYRIKDNALLLSSKFNKHFNTFLNAVPIRDSSLEEIFAENFYFAIITTESEYESKEKRVLNETLQKHINSYEEILNNCCFDIYPENLKSSLPLEESYYIDISKGSIWIVSQSPRGFYYGIQTLIQIIEHTIFQLDKFEDYVILPSSTIVDFPGWKYRGIAIDLGTFAPTLKTIMDFIPFLVKYKFNNLVLVPSTGFPYSEDEMKKITDLCKFHHLTISLSEDLKIPDNVYPFRFRSKGRYILPDFDNTLKEFSTHCSNRSLRGVSIALFEDKWNCPISFLQLEIPNYAEILWNPQLNYSPNFSEYMNIATYLNLFESILTPDGLVLSKMRQSSSSTEETIDFTTMYKSLANTSEHVYENKHLLEILKWGFQSWELEFRIKKLKSRIDEGSSESDFISELQIHYEKYLQLNPRGIALLESSDRVQKGEVEKYFQSHSSILKTLVDSWLIKLLHKNATDS